MGLIDDPISGVLGAFFQRAIESKIWRRLELILELVIASTICFLITTGTTLLSKQPIPLAIGAGMVVAGVAMLTTFAASPNSKGLTIAVTAKAAAEKLDTPTTTIERK
jgi:hypothetical protein